MLHCCSFFLIAKEQQFLRTYNYKYLPSEEDGEEGDAGGSEPGEEDHQHGGPHRDGRVVHQRLGDGVVSAEIVNNACILLRYVIWFEEG